MLARLGHGAPLAQVFAAGLKNVKSTPQVMKEAIDETGRAVAHKLERFLTTLGTVTISPLLGLLGTVIGMIEILARRLPPAATRSCTRMASRSRFITPRWG